jgi:hypothetical protein
MSRLLVSLITALALGAPVIPVSAAETGIAKGVTPQATARHEDSVRDLVVGSDVQIGETVTTGKTGLVQLLFNDGTKLAIGPSSSLVLQDYLVRQNNSAGKFAIQALAGSFRFVTGQAPKNDYEISTPTGTIGVRGTGFDFTIASILPALDLPQGPITTYLLLFDGSVRVCNLARVCAEISDICDFGVFNQGGAVDIDNVRESRAAFRRFFPFATSERVLLFPFWITGARVCVFPPPNVPTVPGTLASQGSPSVPIPPTTTTESTVTTSDTTTTTTTTVPPPPDPCTSTTCP